MPNDDNTKLIPAPAQPPKPLSQNTQNIVYNPLPKDEQAPIQDVSDWTVEQKQAAWEQLQNNNSGPSGQDLNQMAQRYAPPGTMTAGPNPQIDWSQGPAQNALNNLGYNPTYWENPAAVVRWHNIITANPDGVNLPDGMNISDIEQAYKWYQFRNGDKSPDQWNYLDASDPGRSFLQSMQTPPDTLLMPYEASYYNSTVQDKEAAPDRAQQLQQFDWKQPNFNWQGLTIDQKNAILNNPEFDIKDVPTSQQGMIISDPTFDFMGKIASGKLPWWQAPAFYGLSSPYTAPLAQGVIMGAPILLRAWSTRRRILTGGAIAALGYGANINGPVGDAARTLGQWLMKGAQTIEQVAGTIPQVAGPLVKQRLRS